MSEEHLNAAAKLEADVNSRIFKVLTSDTGIALAGALIVMLVVALGR
jgi:hypothetical protein